MITGFVVLCPYFFTMCKIVINFIHFNYCLAISLLVVIACVMGLNDLWT